MNRSQLEHIIRAAAGNTDTNDIVVIGSQAILASHPDAPSELLVSVEAMSSHAIAPRIPS